MGLTSLLPGQYGGREGADVQAWDGEGWDTGRGCHPAWAGPGRGVKWQPCYLVTRSIVPRRKAEKAAATWDRVIPLAPGTARL